MIKLCSSLRSHLKKSDTRQEPLIINNSYSNVINEDNQNYKFYEMCCRCDSKCQHTSCDFSPILNHKEDRIQKLENILYMRDSVILYLNERIKYNENSLNYYSENYQLLINQNKFLRDDNEFLVNSKLYSKKRTERFRMNLSVVPEHGVFQDKKTIFPLVSDMSLQKSI